MAYSLTSQRWNPWSDLLSLQQEMNRLFEGTIGRGVQIGLLSTDFVPPVDVLRDSEKVVVKVDLPGMKKEDLDLTVVNNRLFIRGEKKQEAREEKDQHLHRVERFFGTFERVIDLPNPVDADKIRATFVDGVLEVHAPLREEARPRHISVEGM